MENIGISAEALKNAGVYFFIAATEALGLLFLLIKLTGQVLEQCSGAWMALLYVLLLLLFLLILVGRDFLKAK